MNGCGVVAPGLLSTHPCAPGPLTSLPTFLLTTSPSPAPLTSVRWPDSNAQAAASGVLAHVLLFPLPPRSQLFHRSYSNKHTFVKPQCGHSPPKS